MFQVETFKNVSYSVKGLVAGSMNFGFREIPDWNQCSRKPKSANFGN